MAWISQLGKKYSAFSNDFFQIIEDFDNLGEIIFEERNTLKKISHPTLGILAVKSFKEPHLINKYIYTTLRKSKSNRSFQHAQFLLSKNINTPEPIAYFEKVNKHKLYRSFYFSKYYEYDFTFRELIGTKENFNNWETILTEFTQFIFKVHEANILFKDLSPGNVLIKKTEFQYEFSLIDLNRMSFKELSLNNRLQNFIRLSMTDAMIPIIGNTYAQLVKQKEDKIIDSLIAKNHQYIKKKDQKKNLKKLIKRN